MFSCLVLRSLDRHFQIFPQEVLLVAVVFRELSNLGAWMFGFLFCQSGCQGPAFFDGLLKGFICLTFRKHLDQKISSKQVWKPMAISLDKRPFSQIHLQEKKTQSNSAIIIFPFFTCPV